MANLSPCSYIAVLLVSSIFCRRCIFVSPNVCTAVNTSHRPIGSCLFTFVRHTINGGIGIKMSGRILVSCFSSVHPNTNVAYEEQVQAVTRHVCASLLHSFLFYFLST